MNVNTAPLKLNSDFYITISTLMCDVPQKWEISHADKILHAKHGVEKAFLGVFFISVTYGITSFR